MPLVKIINGGCGDCKGQRLANVGILFHFLNPPTLSPAACFHWGRRDATGCSQRRKDCQGGMEARKGGLDVPSGKTFQNSRFGVVPTCPSHAGGEAMKQ